MDVLFHVAKTMLGHKIHTGVQSHNYEYLDEQRKAYAPWASLVSNVNATTPEYYQID
ncbi:hypothetical protein HQQ94_18090 [Shewanella sp. VB17]|uniref:hypothetical protein n=1 Tax=Shewanella sp. VB17 TaxID=2739432 RepID=UPI001C26FBFD|nr:hypothetical protein [Shewanella sp. VB17]NRD75093.1 hypothetical protein [Shewanella sp. VB17]